MNFLTKYFRNRFAGRTLRVIRFSWPVMGGPLRINLALLAGSVGPVIPLLGDSFHSFYCFSPELLGDLRIRSIELALRVYRILCLCLDGPLSIPECTSFGILSLLG